jgi:hypothetical protein
MKINCSFFNTVAAIYGFLSFYWIVFQLGKFKNACLYYITEFVMTLLRIAVLVALCYFVFYKQTGPMIKELWFAYSANWWKDPKEIAFVVNASVINAFFCWVIWTAFWLFFSFICLYLIIMLIVEGSRFLCRDIPDMLKNSLKIFPLLRCYIWCLTERQIKKYYAMRKMSDEEKEEVRRYVVF